MSLTNSPDPALREAVVRQDLKSVLHPIVQHKALESKQMVVAGGLSTPVTSWPALTQIQPNRQNHRDEALVLPVIDSAPDLRADVLAMTGSSGDKERERRQATHCQAER